MASYKCKNNGPTIELHPGVQVTNEKYTNTVFGPQWLIGYKSPGSSGSYTIKLREKGSLRAHSGLGNFKWG